MRFLAAPHNPTCRGPAAHSEGRMQSFVPALRFSTATVPCTPVLPWRLPSTPGPPSVMAWRDPGRSLHIIQQLAALKLGWLPDLSLNPEEGTAWVESLNQ